MRYLNKDYKVLVSDFDGTLVDGNLNFSEKLKEATSKLIGKGYIFSIATGRCYQGIIKKVCKDLQLTAPQIISGGAEIIDPKTDNLLWHEHIPSETAEKIINYFLDENMQFAVESKGCVFTSSGFTREKYGPDIFFNTIEQLDYSCVPKIVLDKAGIVNLQKKEEELNSLYPDLHIVRAGMAGSPVLDITSAKATKHLAVLQLSKILSINPEHMIGVGDGYNDYPLLSVCGLKAAMGSAPKELKEIADIILPDVFHDGLTVLIDNLYLKNAQQGR